MSVETQIETALFTHVAGLDFDPDVPLAWPNVDFTPPDGSSYIRVHHLPNINTRLFVKGSAPHLRQGILQLTVVSALNVGPSVATAIADAIADQTPADLALFDDDVKVRIQKVPDVRPDEKTDVSWDVRVDIYYEALA